MTPGRQGRGRGGVPGAALVLCALLAGCGALPGGGDEEGAAAPTTSASSVRLKAGDLRAGQAVPAAAGAPVLTLTGDITQLNGGDALTLDAATLDRLGLTRVELFEPWTKQTMTFQGAWLADLLEVAGAAADAGTVHATALDDYQVDITMADVRAGGIFLATRDGSGTAIPIEDGGPTRIVYVGGVESGRNDDQWIWSLKNLDVR